MFWAVSYREILSGRIGLLSDLRYGFVFFGGVLGSVATAWAAKSWLGFEFLALADYFSVALPLGHAVGRLGCLAAGCCYGRPAAWGIVFPVLGDGIPRIPTQLFEAAGGFAICLGLLLVPPPPPARHGRILGLFLVAYAILRFGIEFLRDDPRGSFVAGLSPSQWLSVVGLAIGAWLAARRAAA